MTDNSRVRVSIVGVVIVALFSSLVARLWFLQMGPEQRGLRERAIALSTRRIQTESPRGRIISADGAVLAVDRAAWAVTLDRDLDRSTAGRVLGQLSELLGVPEPELVEAYTSPRQSPLKPAVVELDISTDQRLAILQHRDDYPGVGVVQLTVRSYPQADPGALNAPALAAHVLGHVGEIDAQQLKKLKKKGYQPGSMIGRDGVEVAYESVLRGKPRVETVQIDPTGRQIGAPLSVVEGTVGSDIVLTVDSKLQLLAEQALQQAIDAARARKPRAGETYASHPAKGGAALVLDATDGSLLALASNPSVAPQRWVEGISQAEFELLQSDASNKPFLNRATQGEFLPGSTFKLVSGLALTRYGVRGMYFPYEDTGSFSTGGSTFYNDGGRRNGPTDLAKALTVSSDAYFYSGGNDFWHVWNDGDLARGLGMQTQARELGFGQKTGVELPEAAGLVPDPDWKKRFAEAYYATPEARQENAIWYPADEILMAVGQGGVNVTPVQLALAYAAFANGGTLVTPHVGREVRDPATNGPVRTIAPKPRAVLSLDPNVRAYMDRGFRDVVQGRDGTAASVFQGFDFSKVSVAGKTGTAQKDKSQAPTSWFVAYFTLGDRTYVALAVIEEGGYGAEVSAPVVRQLIEHMAGLPLTPIPGVPEQP
jgi:penicillin-binding protein 2